MEKSEELFEVWASANGWTVERIPAENGMKTPDYRITRCSDVIYAEVKEIVANKAEVRAMRQLEERGFTDPIGGEPGLTVRDKIKDSYHQIKRFAKADSRPGILVLYNNTGMIGSSRIDAYHVLTGMFGLQTVPIRVSRSPENPPLVGPDFLGPKKSVRESEKRYLSGILVLREHYERGLIGNLYHNPFARFPVEREQMSAVNCYQYTVNFETISWDLA